MKKFETIVFVLLLMIALLMQGCSSSKYPEERNKQWVKDIEYVQKSLPLLHANLFALMKEEDFNTQMEKLKKDIPEINDDEIQIRLMEILAPAGDAHLIVMNVFNDVMDLFASNAFYGVSCESGLKEMLPVKALWFGDDMIVVQADKEYEELLGAKMVKIGDKPVSEAMDSINTLISHNNQQRLKYMNVMLFCHPQVLRHFGLLKGDKLSLELIQENGQTISKDVKVKKLEKIRMVSVTESLSERPLYMSREDYFWYEYLPESNAVYFRLRTYGDMSIPVKATYGEEVKKTSKEPSPYNSFSTFLQDMIKCIEDKKPEKIIIDLRGNNGGYIPILDPLRKFIKDNQNIPVEGSVFILEDKGCFSAPILDGTLYKPDLKALVVGEETGERPFIMGAGAYVLSLPNSRVSILYAKGEFKAVDENVHTLVPDIKVDTTFEDYKNGVDPVLQKALDY